MKDLFNLSGKTILITGGAGLLGRQHAAAVMRHGATVIIGDIDYEKAATTAEALNEEIDQGRAIAERLNVLQRESICNLCDKYDQIDVLINNAAKDAKVENQDGSSPRFETMSYEYWQNDMKVGLDGCFLCSQVVINKMLRAGSGVVLNIASDLSVIAPDQRIYHKEGVAPHHQYVKPVTYSVSKWAVLGLTKYLATYYADRNIRVNSLSPAGLYNPSLPTDFVRRLTSLVPMGRMAEEGEYAGAVAFLCSDASKYMTGQNLVMDGGRSVW